MFRTLTPILSILAALAIFFLFIRPHFEDARSVQQEANAYKQAAADYASFKDKIEILESKRDGVSVVERDRLDMFIPKELNTTQSFVDLESLAKQQSMLFGNVQVIADTSSNANPDEDTIQYNSSGQPIAPGTPMEHADLGFSLIGSYDQFKAFLASLEKSLSLFEVIHIETEAKEGSFMQFDVVVRTYSLPSVTKS